jgi:serine/threonine-protein kinase
LIYRFGDFELSAETYELRRAGTPVHLEPRVFELLAYLLAHRRRVVPKEELLAQLWPAQHVSEAALSGAVRDARRALGDKGVQDRWIQTVHGRGYRFAGEAVDPAGPDPRGAGAEAAAARAPANGTGGPLDEPPTRRVADPRFERLVLIGRRHWDKRTEAGLQAGASCFQQALEIDPLDPRAWVGLADCYNLLANHGFVDPTLARSRTVAAAERALALEPESTAAVRALATAAYLFDFDWERSERLFLQALGREPDDALSHYLYGALLGTIGRFDEGLAELRRSAELEPLMMHAPAACGWVLHRAGRSAEGVERLRRVLPLAPEIAQFHWWLGEALVETGDHDLARASLQRALRLGDRPSSVLAYLAHAEGRAGRLSAARELLAELDQRASTGYLPPYYRALVFAGLGERETALAELERAWNVRDTWLRDLKVDPSFASLRSDPRYRRLLELLGLGKPLLASPPPP